MSDSNSKKFGDAYLGKLKTELDKPAPVFNQSLFAGTGQGTRNAWDAGTQFGNEMNANGGLTGSQRDAIGTMNDVGSSYWWAGDRSRQQLGDVDAGYGAMRANGGLSAGQSGAMGGLGGLMGQAGSLGGLSGAQSGAMSGTQGLGTQYGGLAGAFDQEAPGYARMRQGLLDDAVKNVGSGFTASGRFGGGSYINDATEASLNAIAPLDYQNYTAGVNNKYRSLDSQRGVNQDVFGMGQQGKANDAQALAAQQGLYGDMFGMGQQGISNQMGALSGQAGVANSNFANNAAAAAGRMGAASSVFGMGQQGINNRQAGIDALGQIGAAQDATSQAELMGRADLFDRTNNAQLNQLLKVNSGMNGNAAAGANEAPWWQQGLSGLLGFGGKALSGGLFG